MLRWLGRYLALVLIGICTVGGIYYYYAQDPALRSDVTDLLMFVATAALLALAWSQLYEAFRREAGARCPYMRIRPYLLPIANKDRLDQLKMASLVQPAEAGLDVKSCSYQDLSEAGIVIRNEDASAIPAIDVRLRVLLRQRRHYGRRARTVKRWTPPAFSLEHEDEIHLPLVWFATADAGVLQYQICDARLLGTGGTSWGLEKLYGSGVRHWYGYRLTTLK